MRLSDLPVKKGYKPLNDIAVKNAKKSPKPYKLTDGRGMHLLVNGVGKYWRFDYRFAGKRKTLALGVYPDVGLKQARERRDEARRLVASGIDPSHARKAAKGAAKQAAVNSFEAISREWFGKFSPGRAKSHSDKIIRRLEKNVFPWLGNRPISQITAPELLVVLRRIDRHYPERRPRAYRRRRGSQVPEALEGLRLDEPPHRGLKPNRYRFGCLQACPTAGAKP